MSEPAATPSLKTAADVLAQPPPLTSPNPPRVVLRVMSVPAAAGGTAAAAAGAYGCAHACANCGGVGHVFRTCSHPITSFGLVCFRLAPHDPCVVQYLMVQRNDSLCFVEFVRGKYNLQNRGYLLHLFRNMTADERERVAEGDFDALWNGFWQQDNRRHYTKEYDQARTRYITLRDGFHLRPSGGRSNGGGDLVHVSLADLLAATAADHRPAPEFGFPKGRRNLTETDLQCACREFREESGIALEHVRIVAPATPFEETFTGCNRVRYRHVYFLATLSAEGAAAAADHVGVREVTDPQQRREVRATAWVDAASVVGRLEPDDTQRIAMFNKMHAFVMRHVPQAPPPAGPAPGA